MKPKERKQGDDARAGLFREAEWNFSDPDKLPDDELVACCYWEYARESASIRDAVKIAKVAQAEMGIPKPETEEREAFRATVNQAYSLLHSTGFDLAFWVGLPFPEAWQSLDKTVRERWAHVCPKIPTPCKIPPFRVTGDLMIGSILHGEARKAHEARQALYLRLSQIDRGVANLKEAAEVRNKLSELEKHPTPALLRGIGGVDSFIAQINWREFTDKEIVASFEQWVKDKTSRPVDDAKRLVGRRSDQGNQKQNRWRVMLDRLAILRLLNRATLTEMPEKFPEAWKRMGQTRGTAERTGTAPAKRRSKFFAGCSRFSRLAASSLFLG